MTTRMLLSHNCTLSPNQVHPLSRTDFAAVFSDGLKAYPDLQYSLIDNPHWMVEIIFDESQKSPTEVANLCAQSLIAHRSATPLIELENHTVMLLGGLKTTPARSNSPTSLQPGEWGVDVVETLSPDGFLANINWETLTQGKSTEQVFKVMQVVG